MFTSLSSESIATAAGLACELVGFLVMTRDIFRLRSLDKFVKNITIKKDGIYADSAVECYTINQQATAAISTAATLFLIVRGLLGAKQGSKEFQDFLLQYSDIANDFKKITYQSNAQATQMTNGIKRLTDNFKKRNEDFKTASEKIDGIWIHAVKFGMVLVIIGMALEFSGVVFLKS